MILHLVRKWFSDRCTIGELYVDDTRECFVLEDVIRPEKIANETAIPYGTYRIDITYSPRFKREMPLLCDVPGFTGIRIHCGNTDKDTAGCLLVGRTRGINRIDGSRQAYDLLFAKLQVAHKAEIPISIIITKEKS